MTELLELTVNGHAEVIAARPEATLLDVLRQHFQLFGVREACGIGICGACTVAVDGRQVSACLMLVGQAAGREVETVEALSADGDLHPIQAAFLANNAFQCSYCTPGFLMATRELLAGDADPTPDAVRHYLAGNLCRCGSYLKIEAAVLEAAKQVRAAQ
ncbi:MAG: (2Fe-2S)-binding protein [Candidatus Limnocylindrales bacterium]